MATVLFRDNILGYIHFLNFISHGNDDSDEFQLYIGFFIRLFIRMINNLIHDTITDICKQVQSYVYYLSLNMITFLFSNG